jgi:hypothetical protein
MEHEQTLAELVRAAQEIVGADLPAAPLLLLRLRRRRNADSAALGELADAFQVPSDDPAAIDRLLAPIPRPRDEEEKAGLLELLIWARNRAPGEPVLPRVLRRLRQRRPEDATALAAVAEILGVEEDQALDELASLVPPAWLEDVS